MSWKDILMECWASKRRTCLEWRSNNGGSGTYIIERVCGHALALTSRMIFLSLLRPYSLLCIDRHWNLKCPYKFFLEPLKFFNFTNLPDFLAFLKISHTDENLLRILNCKIHLSTKQNQKAKRRYLKTR